MWICFCYLPVWLGQIRWRWGHNLEFPSKWALPPAFARMILKNSKESLSLLREGSG